MSFHPDLNGKTILITGASGDIGLALCEKFLDLSCQVYAVYHRQILPLQALQQRHSSGKNLYIIKFYITDSNATRALATMLEQQQRSLDVLINNAGINKDNLFTAMSDDEFDQVIKVNIYGTFNTCKSLLRLLRRADEAAIVNISSVAGVTASFGQANYSAAKAGINGFTRTLAAEYAGKGIRVNAVAPGMIESDMVKKVPRQMARSIISAIPLKRLGDVNEVANVVAFLSSSSASYIVGQTLVVDGGLVMR